MVKGPSQGPKLAVSFRDSSTKSLKPPEIRCGEIPKFEGTEFHMIFFQKSKFENFWMPKIHGKGQVFVLSTQSHELEKLN